MVDRPARDPRRARSALLNLIPTTTESATAITLIYPELNGRLNGHAVRVPLLNASLTDCVFEMKRRTSAEEGLVHHSDRGSQYLAIRYTKRLAEPGIEPSVGSVGDSYDNALAETINGLFKAEVVHRRGPWRSFEAVEYATLEWVDWFNNRRLLEPIGNIPPAEAETNYYAALELPRMAA